VPLGEKLLEQEATFDHLFASHSITADSLKTITAKIGATRAALRDTHLKYHLQTVQVLTPEQMQRYAVLRGYATMQHYHNMQ